MPMSNLANPYSAAASAAGYLFQCRYALLLALSHVNKDSGLELSIEKFDDVAFAEEGDPRDLIQTKHHLNRAGDLTDASGDLWRTLRAWSDAVVSDPSILRRVRFVLVTTATAPAGSIASLLRPGTDRQDLAAHDRLVAVANSSSSTTNEPFYTAFLDLAEATRLALVRSIAVLDGAPNLVDTGAQIADRVSMAAPRDKVSLFAERLEGWWWGRVCRALTRPEDAVIQIAEVEAKVDELREDFQRKALPVDMADAYPPEAETAAYDARPFIRQLLLIGVGGRRLDFAKRDYYRAFEQRSRWTREKLLFDGEISAYDRRLHEEWDVRFETMKGKLDGVTDEGTLGQHGQVLYEWVEQSARFALRSVVEPFLTVGSYHMLADRLKVGWHRDFPDRIADDNGPGNEEGGHDDDNVV